MSRQPTWFQAFVRWLRQSSPTGAWLYRGQAARHGSISPVLLRGSNRHLYGDQLRAINRKVAWAIGEGSPLLDLDTVYPHLPRDDADRELHELMALFFGTAPTSSPVLNPTEVVQALAQHYGFPTLFIDLTPDPMVAAFFATQRWVDGRYTASEEPGVVYRWPSQRSSPARLGIMVESSAGEDAESIAAIDLTEINLLLRRPRNQRAVMAVVVTKPFSFIPPEFLGPSDKLAVFWTPIDQLSVTDLAQLPSCERFELPAGAGQILPDLTGATAAALFPDRIDLGYSYFSVITLLSICLHHPDEWWGVDEIGDPDYDTLRAFFDRGLDAGRSLLSREAFRLVKDFPAAEARRGMSLVEARATLMAIGETARAAAQEIGSPRVVERRNLDFDKRNDAIRRDWEHRCLAWGQALREFDGTVIEFGDAPVLVPKSTASASAGVVAEIDKRLSQALKIADHSGKLPVYALEDPLNFGHLVDAFPSDVAYEVEVKEQLAADRRWRRSAPAPLHVGG